MTQAAKFWDKIAPKYAKDPIKDMAGYAAGMNRIRPHLAGQRVVELGCGTGMTALALAPTAASYLGTDVSSGMISECRRRGGDVAHLSFAVGTAADLPKGGADVILALNLLHLIADLDADLAHIHAALSTGGLFISKTVVQPNSRFRLKFRLMMAAAKVYQWLNPGLTVTIDPAQTLEARIKNAGFDIVSSDLMGDRQFIVAKA